MPHSTSPLAILSHRFLAFECHATASEVTGGALTLTTATEISAAEGDPLLWKVILTVGFQPEDPAVPATYAGRITIEGQFRIDESFREANREALIRVTATSILYGACREMIAGFTARSIHGILSLPSLSFRQPGEMAKFQAAGTE